MYIRGITCLDGRCIPSCYLIKHNPKRNKTPKKMVYANKDMIYLNNFEENSYSSDWNNVEENNSSSNATNIEGKNTSSNVANAMLEHGVNSMPFIFPVGHRKRSNTCYILIHLH